MATTTNISDFELSLLVYGVTLTDTERKALSKMSTKIRPLYNTNVVKYVESKNIFIVNQELVAADRYYTENNAKLEKTKAKNDFKYIYTPFSRTNVLLQDIKKVSAMEAVQTIVRHLTRYQAFTSGFKNELIYKKLLGKDNLEFNDELELEKYIFDVVQSIQLKEMKPQNSSIYPDDLTTLAAQLSDLGWSLNGPINKKTKNDDDVIQLVLEKNNWRFFVINNYGGLRLGLSHNSDPWYNYIDVDRQFYQGDLQKPLNDIGTVLTREEEENLQGVVGNRNKFEVITQDLIDTLTNAHQKKISFEKRKQTLSKALQTKVEYKIKLIEDGTETFKLNEIEYGKDSIEYSGQKIKVLASNNVNLETGLGAKVLASLYQEAKTNFEHDEKNRQASTGRYGYAYYRVENGKRFGVDLFKNTSTPVHSINDITFDILYDEFMAHIYNGAVHHVLNRLDTELDLQIGDVIVKLRTKRNVNIKGITSISVYLNDIKLTKDDLFYCIYQAISYDDQKKYDAFLSSVSYTSLKVHKLTKSGLYLNFYDYLLQQNITLTIPVKRVKNKNFLVINGSDKRIRKTSSILSLPRKSSILDVVKALVNPDIVENLDYKDLKGFINKGQEEYKKLQEKKQKLINNTINALDIEMLENVILENGNTLEDVYKVKGNLRSYYVESSDPYRIYSAKEGRYICMLDKTPYVSPEVKLINRFYALRNDSVISKEVSTLDF